MQGVDRNVQDWTRYVIDNKERRLDTPRCGSMNGLRAGNGWFLRMRAHDL